MIVLTHEESGIQISLGFNAQETNGEKLPEIHIDTGSYVDVKNGRPSVEVTLNHAMIHERTNKKDLRWAAMLADAPPYRLASMYPATARKIIHEFINSCDGDDLAEMLGIAIRDCAPAKHNPKTGYIDFYENANKEIDF